jgi:hypothetical protein
MADLFDDTEKVEDAIRLCEVIADPTGTKWPLTNRDRNAISLVLTDRRRLAEQLADLKDLARRTLEAQRVFFREKKGLDQCKALERELRDKAKE